MLMNAREREILRRCRRWRCQKLETVYSGLDLVLVPKNGIPIRRTSYLVITTRCPIMVIMRLYGLGASWEHTESGKKGRGRRERGERRGVKGERRGVKGEKEEKRKEQPKPPDWTVKDFRGNYGECSYMYA